MIKTAARHATLARNKSARYFSTLLRSVLYTPGSNERALDKILSKPSPTTNAAADAYILDLEDAVAPNSKEAARNLVIDKLQQSPSCPLLNSSLSVRINGLDTPWGHQDLQQVATAASKFKIPLKAIVIPKVESTETIQQVNRWLSWHNAPSNLELWAMIETPDGVLNARDIAACSKVSTLVMGTSDLTKELGCATTPGREALQSSLGLVILAAKSRGVAVLDGVHLDLKDTEGFEATTVQARELGFDGKTLIHPKTIDFANKVFSPTSEQVLYAKNIVKAFNEASEGIVVYEGKLIENLHVEAAVKLLALHESIVAKT